MDNIKPPHLHHKKILTALLVGASLVVGGIGVAVNARTEIKAPTPEEPIAISYPNPFDSISVEGKAAYVLDVNSGKVLFNKNANKPLPLASITKVMTALVATTESTKNEMVAIDDKALQTEGDSGLKRQEKWNLKDLLDFTLIESSNDGAAAVADAISPAGNFISEMNNMAQKIGLTHTTFKNETGLDINAYTPGATGSAEDVAKLFQYVIKTNPNLLNATPYNKLTLKSLDGISHTAKNTNQVTGQIPGLLASKTGYTDLAGGNLAVAFDAGINRPVIVVVLGSSQEGRFTDVVNLASTTLAYLSVAEK